MIADQLNTAPAKEPRSVLAGILALLVHIVFIALLIFGFNWKDQPPEGMIVELWQDLSQPVDKTTPPPAEPKQQPKPAPEPKSEPKPEPAKTKPAPINVAPPPPKKPDFELKEKTEKPKPVQKEPKPDAEEQKRKEQEKAEAERLQREKEAQKQQELEEQRKREQEEQRKREEAQQKRQQEEKARLEAQQAAARAQIASEIGKYKAMILAKIKSRIVMPPDLPGNPVTEFNVTLLPGGDILDVRLRKSSGYPAFDSAVERAILLSKPLPLPPNPALFNEFRNLHVTVHYLE